MTLCNRSFSDARSSRPWRGVWLDLTRFRWLPVFAVLLAVGNPVVGIARADATSDLRFFEERIRPLLIEQCYECHSAHSGKVKGQFLADSRGAIRRGGESRQAAVVPGDIQASRLITAVRWADPDLQMPPKKRLTPAQVADLEAWVKMGAPDPREETPVKGARRPLTQEEARAYWAYQPLHPVVVPAVDSGKVPSKSVLRTPVDSFVAARLAVEGLGMAGRADWRHLMRRASFAITGLPPDETDVRRVEREGTPEAFQRAVDQMLANPGYGERWGRHWLDVARFAESSGFEHDYDRPNAWHYRDFVIRALNRDMPYNQFVQWQLAGDELAPDDSEALMATGFLGAGVFPTQITANEVERVRYDALDDMATTTGVGLLGLSVGCARCHDHKFDPISSRDYYRLISTFTTTVRSEVDLDLDPEANQARQREWDASHQRVVAARDDYERAAMEKAFQAWLAAGSGEPAMPAWLIASFKEAVSEGGATLTPQPDGSLLASGKSPEFDGYRFVIQVPRGELAAVRIEALSHASFVRGGPGRADNGNFALSDLKVAWRSKEGVGDFLPLKLLQPKATFEQKGLPVAATIDAEAKSGWAVDPQFGKDHAATFVMESPMASDGAGELQLTLRFDINNRHSIGRPRVSLHLRPSPSGAVGTVGTVASAPAFDAPALRADGVMEAVDAWKVPAANRTKAQWDALRTWHRSIDPGWKRHADAVAASLAAKPKPSLTKVMVATEGLPAMRMHTQGADYFEKTFFLRRGDVNQKGDAAPAGFLPVLMRGAEGRWQEAPPSGWRTSYRRRGLARWITDTDAGAGALLARVMVNRVWAAHFGRGLVATPNDFGVQGEAPSHPELLEWLAGEFVRSGWSLKALHRLILDSAVWQQSTLPSDAPSTEVVAHARRVDPGNVWLWHFPRKRLEAEAIRDHLLAVSGVLDQRMGGAGTLDENHLRRSVYFMVKRSQMSRTLQLFDAPDAVLSAANRPATITAPQALLFLNSPFVRARAVDFARRLMPELTQSPEAAVERGYLLATGRPPTARERSNATAFLEQQTKLYAEPASATEPKRALVDLCQVLFGLNEFIYVD